MMIHHRRNHALGQRLRPPRSLLLLLMLAAPVVLAQAADDTPAVNARRLIVPQGESRFIDSPEALSRVSVTSPDILDAHIINPHQLMLNGKGFGTTYVVLWDRGEHRQVYEVAVQLNVTPLQLLLAERFPQARFDVTSLRDTLVLSGDVADEATATKAVSLAQSLTKNVVNLLRTPTPPPKATRPQIRLQVRFAEVDRSRSDELGMNLFSTGAFNTLGSFSTQQFSPPMAGNGAKVRGAIGAPLRGSSAEFTLSDLLNFFAFRPDLNLGLTIKNLEARGLLQILAEPTLTTTAGKEASFLAGGEFPYAVIHGGVNGSTPAITIQFKKFGVQLNFTPEVTDIGTIRLKVKPEVSDLDFTNALTVAGYTIPSVRTRQADTEIELRDGQSFAIAGLIDQRVIENFYRMPFISDIPVLGKLFRSRGRRKTHNELIVMVTPRIVRATEIMTPPVDPPWGAPFLVPETDKSKGPDKGENVPVTLTVFEAPTAPAGIPSDAAGGATPPPVVTPTPPTVTTPAAPRTPPSPGESVPAPPAGEEKKSS